jgi:hypothetical protein
MRRAAFLARVNCTKIIDEGVDLDGRALAPGQKSDVIKAGSEALQSASRRYLPSGWGGKVFRR